MFEVLPRWAVAVLLVEMMRVIVGWKSTFSSCLVCLGEAAEQLAVSPDCSRLEPFRFGV